MWYGTRQINTLSSFKKEAYVAHRRSFTQTRGAKRKSEWFQFQDVAVTNTGNSSTLVFSLNAAALAVRPFTVVRTHFAFYLESDQAAGHETQAASWGAVVVGDQAVLVGITALPLPDTDLGSSLWFAHKTMYADGVALTDVTTPGKYFEVDSKAMRKIEMGDDIVIVVENMMSSGWTMRMAGRMLVKTH